MAVAFGDGFDDAAGLVLDGVTMSVIWAAAERDSSARPRTSSATTAKPLPASPARAASIAAFSASRLVCSAIVVIVSTMPPILRERAEKSSIAASTAALESAIRRMLSVASSAVRAPSAAALRALSAASLVATAMPALEVGGAGGLLDGGAGRLDQADLALGAARRPR